MYFLQRRSVTWMHLYLQLASQFDLIAKAFQELVQESHASPQFLMAKLGHKREKAWRLDNRLLVTSECFTDCHGDTLQHVRIDGPEHLAEDDGVADCANRFVRLGCVHRRLNQLVACSQCSAQQFENAMVVQLSAATRTSRARPRRAATGASSSRLRNSSRGSRGGNSREIGRAIVILLAGQMMVSGSESEPVDRRVGDNPCASTCAPPPRHVCGVGCPWRELVRGSGFSPISPSTLSCTDVSL